MPFWDYLEKIKLANYDVDVFFPWYQIVLYQIVNFLILVPNCPFAILGKIVRFYYLGAKLSGCQMVLPPKDGNGKDDDWG